MTQVSQETASTQPVIANVRAKIAEKGIVRTHLGFVGLSLVLAAVFHSAMAYLLRLSARHEQFSHLPVIPIISATLLYSDRARIFTRLERCWDGSIGIVVGGLLYGIILLQSRILDPITVLSVEIAALVLIWAGAFRLWYGRHAFKAATFPIALLLLMLPVPEFLLDRIIGGLQAGSAVVVEQAFNLLGVPFFRTDLVFQLPGVSIQIAKECSGIRSSMALFIIVLLMSYLFLRSSWARLVLCVAVIPVVILKNGIRIVTLSLIASYVDPAVLSSPLHRRGGFVFFGLMLVLTGAFCGLLKKVESRSPVLGERCATATKTHPQ